MLKQLRITFSSIHLFFDVKRIFKILFMDNFTSLVTKILQKSILSPVPSQPAGRTEPTTSINRENMSLSV